MNVNLVMKLLEEKGVQVQLQSEGLFLLTSAGNKSGPSFLPAPHAALLLLQEGCSPWTDCQHWNLFHCCAAAPYLLCNEGLLISTFNLSTEC